MARGAVVCLVVAIDNNVIVSPAGSPGDTYLRYVQCISRSPFLGTPFLIPVPFFGPVPRSKSSFFQKKNGPFLVPRSSFLNSHEVKVSGN